MGDWSFNERQRLVQAAVVATRGGDCYIAELYDDRAIVEVYGEGASSGKSFEYPYTLDDAGDVTLGEPTQVVRETTYVPVAVKFIGDDLIEGLAIPFGGTFAGKDLTGEAFDAQTDLCLDWFGESGRPILYDHGLDGAMKAVKIGRQTDFEVREEGVWAAAQLDKNARYRKAVDRLIEQQALGYSSGAMPHLATKNSRTGILTRWPWVELSLTPMPAEPSTLGVHYTKSAAEAIDLLESVDIIVPAPLKAAIAALDEWGLTRDSDDPAPGSLEEKAGRVSAAVAELRDHARAHREMRAKTGRVLSAATRERLLRHPASLRELADDLDGLLSEADAEKAAKAADPALLHDVAATLLRAADVTTTGVRS